MITANESSFGQTTGSGLVRRYITKQGDTLEDIAAYFYGDPVQRQRIIDDNPNFATVQPGQSLPAGWALNVSADPARGDTVEN